MSNKKENSIEYYINNLIEILGDEICNKLTIEQINKIHNLGNKAVAMHQEETTITENTSDGYHTFKELYEIRKAYNVALFNEWGGKKEFSIDITGGRAKSISKTKYNVHKSWKHHDGELCFGGGWFIVVAMLPTGQISNHYKSEDWDLFKIPEVEKALFPFDGHTTEDIIKRLIQL